MVVVGDISSACGMSLRHGQMKSHKVVNIHIGQLFS